MGVSKNTVEYYVNPIILYPLLAYNSTPSLSMCSGKLFAIFLVNIRNLLIRCTITNLCAVTSWKKIFFDADFGLFFSGNFFLVPGKNLLFPEVANFLVAISRIRGDEWRIGLFPQFLQCSPALSVVGWEARVKFGASIYGGGESSVQIWRVDL